MIADLAVIAGAVLLTAGLGWFFFGVREVVRCHLGLRQIKAR